MHSLPIFLRLEGRPAIVIGDGDGAAAKRRLLERAGARIVDADSPEARIAIVALEDDAAAAAATAALRARGIWVNAPDRPELCDFTLPAIVDRDPVILAIGTGGQSAGLAKALRQRLEALLPTTLGNLARQLFAARGAIRSRWPDAADRRRAIDAALDGPLSPLTETPPDAVEAWLSAPDAPTATRLETIRIASDDPDLLTLRAARLLGQADTVFHSKAIAPAILNRARADAVRVLAARLPDTLPEGLSLYLTDAETQ
ncbi:bifunctional precorrin-2 dehydrogenase/sirohydrochlorin ferrochelatase [Sphingomonas sp. C3-2]|uniref:precorrin-2 dehydrogenase/sirohydrochlorin ferrochelatase family protein n=1 Tax=Sphingomonas sp. C3-2 TaxID=3062169 RepID=UPI00294B3680|nr:NAD(P)-dependent oxidoreductase [Sphingomonas sp. C3-2]WOK38189.1 NAD(P)-dependent oxidoreductase [Sphingomonas sp. C3-2]